MDEFQGWEIDEDFRVEADALNVTLYRRILVEKGVKAGQYIWRPLGYHSNAESALRQYCKLKLNKGCTSAEGLMEELDTLYDLIDNLAPKLAALTKELRLYRKRK